MTIECPHCGFTGRVPPRATLAPHQARCPKCRYRFDIGDLSVQIPDPVGMARPDLRHDHPRPRIDPSDSSYELDPILAGSEDPWEGPWSDGPDESDEVIAPDVVLAPRPVGRRTEWTVFALRPSTVRIRIFQAWAVLFMACAGAIGVRTALLAARFDDDRFFSGELLRPVAVVVLLVCAAALLCLYVDVSRRLARLTYGPPAPPPPLNPPTAAGGIADGPAVWPKR